MHKIADALAGRYTVEREIGSGGMATVYLARDLKHKRAVAVKVLRPEIAESGGAPRFLREIEIAAGLTHPNILPVLDSGATDDLLYYIMPFVEGESLDARMRRIGALPIAEAVTIAKDVAEALGYAHSLGVIHRDVKPGNVLLVADQAVVADFGLARAVVEAGWRAALGTGFVILIGVAVYRTSGFPAAAPSDPIAMPGAPPAPPAPDTTPVVVAPLPIPDPEPTPGPSPPAAPATGTLTIGNIPGGAQVRINGRIVADSRVELPAGRHQVTIRAAGYEAFDQTVTLVAGRTTTLSVSMTTTSQCADWDPVTYNADGSCFDARPRPSAAVVPLTDAIRGTPSSATFALYVSAEGLLTAVRAVTPSDDSAFTRLAEQFAREIDYVPAQKDGQRVAGWTLWRFVPESR